MDKNSSPSLIGALRQKDTQRQTLSYLPKDKRHGTGLPEDGYNEIDIAPLFKRETIDNTGPEAKISKLDKEEIDNIHNYYTTDRRKETKARAKTRALKFDWSSDEDTLETNNMYNKTRKHHNQNLQEDDDDDLALQEANNKIEESVWVKDYSKLTKSDFNLIRESHNIKLKYPNGSLVFEVARKWNDLELYKKLSKVFGKVYEFQQPTPIQMQAIPLSLKFKDLLCIAPTGSGKTLAYILPLLNFILTLPPIIPEKAYDGPYALVMAPSRELVIQIKDVFDKLAMPLGIRSLLVIGGHSAEDQISNFFSGCEVLFATLGRCQDLLSNHIISLSQCCYIVIDEADKMIELELSKTFEYILEAAAPEFKKSKNEYQVAKEEESVFKGDAIYRVTQMYSATMPKSLLEIANRYLHSPVTVSIETEDKLKQNVSHLFEFINDYTDLYGKKVDLLAQWLKKLPMPAILFANTKDKIDGLNKELKGLRLRTGVYHGGFDQKTREAVIEDLKNGKIDLLLSSDLGGRGLDISNLQSVINFDAPKTFENYIHRSGRTGRAGARGTVFTILSRKNLEIIDSLIDFLEERELKVPSFLYQYSSKTSKGARKDKKTILSI